jgi:hypothetical protein
METFFVQHQRMPLPLLSPPLSWWSHCLDKRAKTRMHVLVLPRRLLSRLYRPRQALPLYFLSFNCSALTGTDQAAMQQISCGLRYALGVPLICAELIPEWWVLRVVDVLGSSHQASTAAKGGLSMVCCGAGKAQTACKAE